MSYFAQPQASVAERKALILRVGEAVVAPFTFVAGKARGVARLAPAKECLKCQVNAHVHVLQHLAVNAGQRRPIRLEKRQFLLLLVHTNRLTSALPRLYSVAQQAVIQAAARFEVFAEDMRLPASWVEPISKSFNHIIECKLKIRRAQEDGFLLGFGFPRGILGPEAASPCLSCLKAQ